ncbi:unnamed protein product [Linum trigynum]|uniref:Uncharacterized protein n=1 Tax=Linum trigynum TaxID=586398 RepID=A0AAV2DXK3_9ROSI
MTEILQTLTVHLNVVFQTLFDHINRSLDALSLPAARLRLIPEEIDSRVFQLESTKRWMKYFATWSRD